MRKYNNLVAQSLTTVEMFPLMGFQSRKSLLNWVSAMRKAGHTVSRAKFVKPVGLPMQVLPPDHLQPRRVGHGGGLVGVKNCRCLPCLNRRAEYMRNWRASKRQD